MGTKTATIKNQITMLHNNSSEMKTVVETFITEETAELIYDGEQLERWNELIAELGLEGQSAIVQPKKSPIPFMHMKEGLKNVFETLCPVKVGVEQYNKTPIPVEILDLIALSNREGYFSRIEVWYDDKSPDPVVVGSLKLFGEWGNYKFRTTKEASEALGKEISNYQYDTAHYLLGKWADVRHSFAELKAMAKERFMESRGAELRSTIKQSERELDDLESEAVKRFN